MGTVLSELIKSHKDKSRNISNTAILLEAECKLVTVKSCRKGEMESYEPPSAKIVM